MFYEKYSEKVFVDCMVDAIMKSKDIGESEALALYNEIASSLTIYHSVCLIEGGASIRQGIIKTLDSKGIDLSELTKKMYLKEKMIKLSETYEGLDDDTIGNMLIGKNS